MVPYSGVPMMIKMLQVITSNAISIVILILIGPVGYRVFVLITIELPIC